MTSPHPDAPAAGSLPPDLGEAGLRLLMERMGDGVFVAQDRRFVFFNPALVTLLGWSAAELAGLAFEEAIHEESLASCTERYRQWIGDGPEPSPQYDMALRHRQGHAVWVELRASRLDYQGRRSVLGIVRDVGERRRAESALRAATRLAQDTLDGLSAHICVLDDQGTVVAVNRAWGQFGGAQGGDPERSGGGINYLEVCSGSGEGAEDAARFAQLLRGVLSGERASFEMQYPCQTAEGPRWFLARVTRGNTVPVRVVVSHEDVTAQHDAEAALREGEQRWKFALEGAGDGVWDWDLAAGTVAFSARWLDMLGYAPGELAPVEGSWWGLIHRQDLARVRAEMQAHLEGRSRVFNGELRMRHRDGGWRWFLNRGIVTSRDPEGRPLRMVGSHTDLTERKQAELERTELEIQLREAQKMDAVGTLAGGVAHDFNNVLAGILGNLELARQTLDPVHPAFANLEQIHRASLRARNLVQQILTFSRHQPQRLLSQPLRPVIEEGLQLLRATLPTVVHIEARLAEAPVVVRADATQVQQVLMNLCTNAWHALQGSTGRIEVGLEVAELAGTKTASGPLSGRHAHLWVSDDGCGMDPAAVARIFEPFYTTKPVGQGTGLGLSVVHGIVSAHGGAVAVESAPGQGSHFHIYLPLSLAPAAVGDASSGLTRPEAASGAGQRVLYVDDDPLMLITVRALLERDGYSVTPFSEGPAAVAAVQADPQAFDIVISDFNMPGHSGLDVAREVSRLRPDLPLIISSGYLSDELRAHASAAGVRRLLQKENTVEELSGAVHQVLTQAAAERAGSS